MEEQKKQEILQTLKAGRDALGDALDGVDDDLASRKPSGGGWSILDCVEHMVQSEKYLLSRLGIATVADHPFEKWKREVKIAGLAADRGRRIEAPEQAHPKGRFPSLGVAVAAFDAARADVVRWVENCAHDPRCMMTDHLLISGPVTCSETLIMIAAHPTRHAKQIAEIREKLTAEP
jgi:uncharacterized damage-inducible protein DinB